VPFVTPIFSLFAPLEEELAHLMPATLQQMVTRLEAVLKDRAAVPGLADLNSVVARLLSLENSTVKPQRIPLASYCQDFVGWQPLMLWCERETVHVTGMVQIKTGQVLPAGETSIGTIPLAYRPKNGSVMGDAYIGGTQLVRCDIETANGNIEIVNGGGFGAGTFIDVHLKWARAALPA
jgi:hypothetical protein